MNQYSRAQIKKIIAVLEKQMATASGKAFDRMERARRGLINWDGTGPMPHEKLLLEMKILDNLDSSEVEATPEAKKPVQAGRTQSPAVSPKQGLPSEASNAVRSEPIPAQVIKKPELKPIPEPVTSAEDRSHSIEPLVNEGRLYDAIKMLKKERSESAEKYLNRLQTDLNIKTRQLAENARTLDVGKKSDFDARKTAWRAVLDLNPDYQEAHEALQQVQRDEIRASTLRQAKDYVKHAEEGERSDNLPMLNEAFAEVQALLARVTNEPSLSDLRDGIQKAARSIENLRKSTRDRLGVMATAEGQGKFKEAYETTRALIGQTPRPPTILGEDGTEQDLNSYWNHIGGKFISWLREKASDYVTDARNVAQSYPELALQKLTDALNILNDESLIKDDSVKLVPDRNNVQDEISKINQQIKEYKEAGDLVREAQGYARPSERKDLLLKAKQIFRTYPDLATLLEDADIDYANELARIGADAAVEARFLAGQDKYDEALKKIADANGQIIAAFPAPKKDTPLYQALQSLGTEKQGILKQKNIYNNMLKQIPDVEKYIKDYDTSKNYGALKAARTLFDDLQKDYSRHPLIQKLNADLVARQSDPDNWSTGIKAYENQNWLAADSAFKEISADFVHYAEVQKLLQRARGALSTVKGRESEQQNELAQAINAYRMAVHIFDGDVEKNYDAYGTDPITVAYAEESRSALERLKGVFENDQRVDAIIKECTDLLGSAKRISSTRRQLVDKVEPIPLFRKAETKLREAISMATTRTDKLYDLLDQVHEIWLSTYTEGLKQVSSQSQKNRTLLQKANLLVSELDEAGLLTGYEDLASKLQADALDMEYAGMGDYRTGHNMNLQKMEENRRKRLSVQQNWPYEEEQKSLHEQKIKELDRTIREIVDRRMKADMEHRLNEALKGYKPDEHHMAYSSVLEEMENDDELTGSVSTITGLIRLAWKARDWQKAETFARRLRENTGADYIAISDDWLILCKAAQAFGENQVDEALAHCAKLPKNLDKDLRTARTELENETVNRLIEEAKGDVALNTDSGYVGAANKYAMAYKISPKNQMITNGLRKIGPHVETTITNLCTSAGTLQLRGVTMDDLDTACREAGARYAALSSFANVAAYLNLKQSQVDALSDATQELASKRLIWDKVQGLLRTFEKDLGVALNQPEKLDTRRDTGGWNLDTLEHYLQEARMAAGRDVQLGRLIENKLTDWNFKKDTADHLNKSVTSLMDAVAGEQFDRVIELSTQLEEDWKRAQRDYGFEGLKILVYETYPNTLGRADTPAQHREIAMRQKQDFEEWSKWAVNVKDKHATLSKIQRELQFRPENWRGLGDDARATELDKRLSIEDGIGMALKDIVDLCLKGKSAASVFLEHFQARPAGVPISKSAQSAVIKVEPGWSESLSDFQKYLSLLEERAKNGIVEVDNNLKSLENTYIKNLRSVVRKDGTVPMASFKMARDLLEKCKKKDPFNREVDRLEQILNSFTPR